MWFVVVVVGYGFCFWVWCFVVNCCCDEDIFERWNYLWGFVGCCVLSGMLLMLFFFFFGVLYISFFFNLVEVVVVFLCGRSIFVCEESGRVLFFWFWFFRDNRICLDNEFGKVRSVMGILMLNGVNVLFYCF